MASDVFISYSSNDQDKVVKLADRLRSAGVSIWVDESGIGAATLWSKEIAGAIKGCKVLLLMVTPNSIQSENVVKEVTLAAEQRKKILPVVLAPTQIPEALEYHLAGIQHLDVSGRSTSESAEEILPALQRLLGMETEEDAASTHTVRLSRRRSSNIWADWRVYALGIMTASLGWLLKPTPPIPAQPEPPQVDVVLKGTNSTLRKIDLHLPNTVDLDSLGPEIADMAIAPDGRKYVFVNTEGLWLRWLDRVSPLVLLFPGNGVNGLFWSPDSTDVGYFLGENLYRLTITGGQPKRICVTAGTPYPAAGGAWFSDDQIFFALGRSDLYKVSAHGGGPTVVEALGENETAMGFANPLPDGRGVLLVVDVKTTLDTIQVWTPDSGRKSLLQIPSSRLWSPVYLESGHVVYTQTGEGAGIWAFPFSLSQLERIGEPIRVSDLGTEPSAAADGTLLLNLTRETIRQLVWVDRESGQTQNIGQPQRGQANPRLSHDERRIATSRAQRGDWDIWITDVKRGNSWPEVRTSETEISPNWYPGDRKIAFRRWKREKPRIFVKPLDGSGVEEELMDGFITHLSRSGKFLTHQEPVPSSVQGYVSLEEPNPAPIPFPDEFQNIKMEMRLSPDDGLLAFSSSESDQNEVYVVNFPSFTNKRIVSRGAGNALEWHPDGSELFYLSADARSLWSVAIKQDENLTESEPTKVLDLPLDISRRGFQVAKDGQRFLMLRNIPEPLGSDGLPRPKALLIENWFEEFREQP